jgi:hypothetical protein
MNQGLLYFIAAAGIIITALFFFGGIYESNRGS